MNTMNTTMSTTKGNDILENRTFMATLVSANGFRGHVSTACPGEIVCHLHGEEIMNHMLEYFEVAYEKAPGMEILRRDYEELDEYLMRHNWNFEKREDMMALKNWLCEKYFDVRAFGITVSTPYWRLVIRGAVELSDVSTVSKGCDYFVEYGEVPSTLFLLKAFVNPILASKTGFSNADLDAFTRAFVGVYDFSWTREEGHFGNVSPVILLQQPGDSCNGQACADKLFDLIRVEGENSLSLALSQLPSGIELGVYKFAADEICWGREQAENRHMKMT